MAYMHGGVFIINPFCHTGLQFWRFHREDRQNLVALHGKQRVLRTYLTLTMSVGWDVKWCTVSRITPPLPLGTLKTVSLDFDED